MKRAPIIDMTEREYQKEFRKRFKELQKAISKFRPGCAYIPKSAFLKVGKAMRLIDEAHEECKVWWRKA